VPIVVPRALLQKKKTKRKSVWERLRENPYADEE
jgi:hypothetical protein